MRETMNIARARAAHTAFLKGDIVGLLERFSDSPDWKVNVPRGTPLGALSGHRTTKDAIAGYFATAEALMEIEVFAPHKYFAEGEDVIVVGWMRAKVRESGRVFDDEFVQRIGFREGLVQRVRIWSDLSVAIPARR